MSPGGGLANSPSTVGGRIEHSEMPIDPANILPLITACVVAVTTASLTPWFTSRAEGKRDLRERNRGAAVDLAAALRDLRTLLRRRGHLPVSPREVSNAVGAWTEAWDRQKHLVPATYGSAGSSVRAAVGELFGAVALVDLRPDLADYPLADPDFMWQDFGACYIDHVLDALVRWGDGTTETRKKILSFDQWLVKSGRRNPVGQNERATIGVALRARNQDAS